MFYRNQERERFAQFTTAQTMPRTPLSPVIDEKIEFAKFKKQKALIRDQRRQKRLR
jgi:hypothetical protein